MAVIGVVCEYDPFHRGHAWHLAQARRQAGEDAAVVCVMSGDVTQRGDFAQWDKSARTRLALAGGADLVLELPPEAASSGARDFAAGAVAALAAAGVVTHLAFGSESGDLSALLRASRAEESPDFDALLRRGMAQGLSYAAARQRALEALAGPAGAVVAGPNDALAVEYLRACRTQGAALTPIAVLRQGGGHHGRASGSWLRRLLAAGDWEQAAPALTEPGAALLREEAAAGRGPAGLAGCPGALFALRRADRAAFLRLPDCPAPLAARLYAAARRAADVESFVALGRSRRVTEARVRRAALHLCLGLTRADVCAPLHFLRVLGFTPRGQALLARMRQCAALPVLVRPGAVKTMDAAARAAFDRLVRASDLRALSVAGGDGAPGREWTRAVVRLERTAAAFSEKT